MVHRMLGNRFGTGGSSGHEYLRVTAARSRIFSDFFNLAGYYIPKVMLPTLPAELEQQLGFSMQTSLSNTSSPRARSSLFTSGTPHYCAARAFSDLVRRRCRWHVALMPFYRKISMK